jgi:hypothetical protein
VALDAALVYLPGVVLISTGCRKPSLTLLGALLRDPPLGGLHFGLIGCLGRAAGFGFVRRHRASVFAVVFGEHRSTAVGDDLPPCP